MTKKNETTKVSADGNMKKAVTVYKLFSLGGDCRDKADGLLADKAKALRKLIRVRTRPKLKKVYDKWFRASDEKKYKAQKGAYDKLSNNAMRWKNKVNTAQSRFIQFMMKGTGSSGAGIKYGALATEGKKHPKYEVICASFAAVLDGEGITGTVAKQALLVASAKALQG